VCEKIYTNGATLSIHLKNVHKYKWPSGHSRFRYKLDNDGYYRLQTLRYESVELVEKLNREKEEREHNQLYDRQSQFVTIVSDPNGATATNVDFNGIIGKIGQDDDDRQFDFDDEDEHFVDMDGDGNNDDADIEMIEEQASANSDRVLYQTFDNFKVYLIQRLIDDESKTLQSAFI
jgi:hypothetical protein